SLRVAADANGHDLRNVIAEIAGKVDGSFGGHTGAAGAVIKTEREQEFIEEAKKAFELLV
ncbi:DHH family phosphoesterase, partial [Candidatus Woesearchaeota archaeon]|nr:DHH family phosphoesterase [Candidatus Woesearchaeota archaeon]